MRPSKLRRLILLGLSLSSVNAWAGDSDYFQTPEPYRFGDETYWFQRDCVFNSARLGAIRVTVYRRTEATPGDPAGKRRAIQVQVGNDNYARLFLGLQRTAEFSDGGQEVKTIPVPYTDHGITRIDFLLYTGLSRSVLRVFSGPFCQDGNTANCQNQAGPEELSADCSRQPDTIRYDATPTVLNATEPAPRPYAPVAAPVAATAAPTVQVAPASVPQQPTSAAATVQGSGGATVSGYGVANNITFNLSINGVSVPQGANLQLGGPIQTPGSTSGTTGQLPTTPVALPGVAPAQPTTPSVPVGPIRVSVRGVRVNPRRHTARAPATTQNDGLVLRGFVVDRLGINGQAEICNYSGRSFDRCTVPVTAHFRQVRSPGVTPGTFDNSGTVVIHGLNNGGCLPTTSITHAGYEIVSFEIGQVDCSAGDVGSENPETAETPANNEAASEN